MKLKHTASVPIFLSVIFILTVIAKNTVGTYINFQNAYFGTVLTEAIVYLIPCIVYVFLKPKGFFKSLSPVGLKFSHIKLITSSAFLLIASGALWSVISYSLGSGANKDNTVFSSAASESPFLAIITMIVIPVIFEEFIFRGIVQREYQNHGKFVCVFFVAICFALMHGTFDGFAFYFITGTVLSLLMAVSESLLVVILVHLLYNLYSAFGQVYIFNLFSNFSDTGFILMLLVIITLLAAFFFLSSLDYHYFQLAYSSIAVSEATEPRKINILKSAANAFLSPYFLLFAVIFFISAFKII